MLFLPFFEKALKIREELLGLDNQETIYNSEHIMNIYTKIEVKKLA